MKWPERLLTDIAAECSHRAERTITVHMVMLGLSLQWRAERGMTLAECVDDLDFTRRYGRAICQLFGLSFPDFQPRTPLNLPLE